MDSPHGTCVHEVQVANPRGQWFARIMTLPGTIWRDSSRHHAQLFQASTREEVEAAAFAHLIGECERRGERLLGLGYDTGARLGSLPARRIVAMCPLQFNLKPGRKVVGPRSIERSFTANLSESGLFIVTSRGLDEGASLDIRLTLGRDTEKMLGVVRWRRQQEQPGRPPGLGVAILAHSPRYRSRLATLQPVAAPLHPARIR